MSIARENRIVNTLLVTCILAGFACFAFILLPEKLNSGNYTAGPKEPENPKGLASLIAMKPKKEKSRTPPDQGNVVKFTPEPEILFPSAQNPIETEPVVPDVAGGPGAAVEDDLFKRQQPFAKDPAPDITEEKTTSVQTNSSEMIGMKDDLEELMAGLEKNVVRHKKSRLALGIPSLLSVSKKDPQKDWIYSPASLEIDVAFWRDIYAKYHTDQVVLHHPKYLDIVYDVVELSDITRDPRLTDREKDYQKEKRIEEKRKNIENILEKLAEGGTARSLTDEEWQLKKLFDGVKENDPFKKALEVHGIRGQRGQRDKFIEGLKYSGKYLGEIEAVYEQHGLPVELTRIIFVESMFNLKAKSHVGASGVWQFMPATGKLYLRINDLVDERNDPILATHASAKLLRHNYNELKTWPLAINAYNAGRGRMQQAVKMLGTRDISIIVKNFEHGSYRFASRNFFPEFLAALEVAEHHERYFGPINFEQPLKYEVVKSPYHISLPDVLRIASIDIEKFEELNPAFTYKVLNGKIQIPSGFSIRIPEGRGELFMLAAARSPKSKKGAIYHVVERGETLATIANTYGIKPDSLRRANSGIHRQPSQGQKLVIPFD